MIKERDQLLFKVSTKYYKQKYWFMSMLNHLKDLVFGIDGYEKVKIDARFEEILILLPNIQIKQLPDFEILEECLYKLKEQLRVKSSNLNRVIKEHNSLTKKKVNFVIEELDKKKYDFLNSAFTLMQQTTQQQIPEVERVEHETVYEPPKQNKVVDEVLIFEDSNVRIELHNGKVPYISVKFEKEVDYNLLKKLAVNVFDILQVQGTNIVVEGKLALIIGRKIDDNLITLPKVQSDLDEIYNKLKQDNNTKEEYVEINEPKATIKTKKKDEDSLDALLSGIEDKKTRLEPKPNPKEDKDEPVLEKGKEIEVERNHKVESEVEIVENNELDPLEIYRDEEIVALFNKDSIVKGEIIVKPVVSKKISMLSESELSYIMLFSKVFATTLFEVLEAQGTNLIWDFKGDSFRIIPRFQNDKLKINWAPKHTSEDFLDQIKTKLLEEMQNEIKADTNEEEPTPQIKTSTPGSNDRAKYILDQLKRIP